MKTKKHLADEKKYNSLAWKIATTIADDAYNIYDYSGCYYEGDSPSLDRDQMCKLIQEILDDNNISNCG